MHCTTGAKTLSCEAEQKKEQSKRPSLIRCAI